MKSSDEGFREVLIRVRLAPYQTLEDTVHDINDVPGLLFVRFEEDAARRADAVLRGAG